MFIALRKSSKIRLEHLGFPSKHNHTHIAPMVLPTKYNQDSIYIALKLHSLQTQPSCMYVVCREALNHISIKRHFPIYMCMTNPYYWHVNCILTIPLSLLVAMSVLTHIVYISHHNFKAFNYIEIYYFTYITFLFLLEAIYDLRLFT